MAQIHVSIKPDIIAHVGDFPITNTLLTTWIVMIALMLGAFLISRKLKDIPSRVQVAVEMTIDGVLSFLAMISNSRESARKHFPLLATVFFVVLFSNWAGVLPGVGSIGVNEVHNGESLFVPLFRSANSDLNITLALAIIVVVASHVIGMRTIGPKHHIGKFLTLKNPIQAFVGLLELISEFAKIISFSFRLFGNIFAGEVLLVIMSFLIPYIIPIPFLGLELFVGIIQASIFAVLGMMFISAAEQMPAH